MWRANSRVCGILGQLSVAALVSAACAREPVGQDEQQSSEVTAAVTDPSSGTRASPTPIIVSWTDTPANGKVQRLSGLVQNTTATAQKVELRLIGMAPSGEIATRSMGSREIPAKSSVRVDYALADLPAQSAGLPSTILLAASYEAVGPGATAGSTVTRTLQATTPGLNVTLDTNGNTATALDAAAQARVNTAKPAAERRATSSKLFDAKAGRLVDEAATPRTQAELAPTAVVTIEGTIGSGPPGRANSAMGVAP